MSQADQLLEAMVGATVASTNPTTEGYIVVGADRFITVPDELKKIGVQYDHDVETVTFECPRYWDDFDLSTKKIYINYMRPDESLGMHKCTNVVADEDLVRFDWTISGHVTEFSGPIAFLVCARETGADGLEITHWNSELNRDMYISEGLKCQETILRRHPDIITQLLVKMEEVEKEQVDWEKATYKELDDRMKTAENNTSKGEILNRINEALDTNETTQNKIATIAQDYVDNEPAIVNIQNTADTALSIAAGANQALSYDSYSDMITVFNAMETGKFKRGQNVYIATVGVPDLWIYSVEETSVTYEYTDDETLANELSAYGTVQIGYYKFSMLETQKVDLRDLAIPLLLGDWLAEEDGDYSQTIMIEGLGSGTNPIVMLSYVGDEPSDNELYSYSCIKDVDISANTIKFTASEIPTVSFTVLVKGVSSSVESVVADITAIVSKMAALETKNSEMTNEIEALKEQNVELNNGLTARYNSEKDCIQVYYNGAWKDTILRCGVQYSEVNGTCTFSGVTNTANCGFVQKPIYVKLTCVNNANYVILYDSSYSTTHYRCSYDGGVSFAKEFEIGVGNSDGDWKLTLTDIGFTFIDLNARQYNYIARGYKS